MLAKHAYELLLQTHHLPFDVHSVNQKFGTLVCRADVLWSMTPTTCAPHKRTSWPAPTRKPDPTKRPAVSSTSLTAAGLVDNASRQRRKHAHAGHGGADDYCDSLRTCKLVERILVDLCGHVHIVPAT